MATTLAQLRSKVRLRYARSSSSGDVATDTLDIAINYSLRQVYNTLGDNAWFLRKVGSFSVVGPQVANTMPPNVRRIYRVEVLSSPGFDIPWTLIRYDNDLNMVVKFQTSGDVQIHYLDIPIDLVDVADVMALPDEHVELVVVLASQRLFEGVANIAMTASFTADLAQLWKSIKRECLANEGQRHEGMRSIVYRGHPSFP
jgi:hypothetical protein